MAAHPQVTVAFPFLKEVAAVSGAAVAICKDLFDALGGFDERFLIVRRRYCPLPVRPPYGVTPACTSPPQWFTGDYRLIFGPLMACYRECNRVCMLLKCLRWRTCLALLHVLLLAEVVTWVSFWLATGIIGATSCGLTPG